MAEVTEGASAAAPTFSLSSDVDPLDDRAHVPEDGDPRWQESFCITWHDPLARVGAVLHLGLQPNRGCADYWTGVVVEGAVVGEEQQITAPLPPHDLTDLRLGPLQVTTLDPLRSYAISTTHGDTVCDVVYTAYDDPVTYVADYPGAEIGFGHFESFGRVDGTVRVGERVVEVHCSALHDHSWGPRDYGNLLTFRNYVVGFGSDLSIQLFDATTPAGRRVIGYVERCGRRELVTSHEGRLQLADDGYTPRAFTAVIGTASGRRYRVEAVTDAVTLNTHYDDYFHAVAYMSWELDGRIGGGTMWARQLGSATSEQRERLGVAAGRAE